MPSKPDTIRGARGPFNDDRSMGAMEPAKYDPKIGLGRPIDDGMVDGDDRKIPTQTRSMTTGHFSEDRGGYDVAKSLAGADPGILDRGYSTGGGIAGATKSDGMEEA